LSQLSRHGVQDPRPGCSKTPITDHRISIGYNMVYRGNGRFPDNHFPGQDVSRKEVSRTTACPDSSIISRTRRFSDNHFPGQTLPNRRFPVNL